MRAVACMLPIRAWDSLALRLAKDSSSPSLENVSAALGLPAGTVARALLVVLGRTLPQASDLCRPPFGLKWGIKPSPLPILYASSAITPTCGQTAYQDVVH